MTTSATPATVARQSFASKLETDLLNVGKKIKAGIEEAGDDAVKLAAFITNNKAEITALAGLAGGNATKVTNIGLSLTNLAVNAVKDAGSAASANGVNVTLDQGVIADVKELIEALEKV